MAARIMVVDDTQEILELFREILEDEGYEVHLHAYASQDLAAIARVAPDLLILDFVMTDERSGWQLLQKLQMRPATAALPVVICTAALRQVEELEGVASRNGQNRTLGDAEPPERPELAAFDLFALPPEVVARQVDVSPPER